MGAAQRRGARAPPPRRAPLPLLLGGALLRAALRVLDRRGAGAHAPRPVGEAPPPGPPRGRRSALPRPRGGHENARRRTAPRLSRLRARRSVEPAAVPRPLPLRRGGLAGGGAAALRARRPRPGAGVGVAGGPAPGLLAGEGTRRAE